MLLNFSTATETGTKHHENEDSILCSPDCRLFAVADGMGGYQGGKIASQIATEVLHEFVKMSESEISPPEETLKDAVLAANFTIFNHSLENPTLIGMGTTLSSFLFTHDSVWVGHVGDSRAYLLRAGELHQLTEDHAAERNSSHSLQRKSPSMVLNRAVGLEKHLEIDLTKTPVLPNDIFLLCSDGLSSVCEPSEIRHILTRDFKSDFQMAATQLVKMAKLRGSTDDISVIVIQAQSL